MKVSSIKTRIFKEGENLLDFILFYNKKIKEGSILIVTSKIVSLSEGRTVVVNSQEERNKLIRKESEWASPEKFAWLTIKDGMPMPAAGIDDSNANGKTILLPKDSFLWARKLRKALQKKFNLKKFGVIITDSRTIPLRAGITGVALGYAGFKGVRDYRGTTDLFGRELEVSRVDVADSVATAAVLVMGEGREQTPLAMVEDAPVEFCDRINQRELHISIEDDMYGPLFKKLPKI